MPKSPYRISPSQVLYQRKQEGVFTVTHSEWKRLKSMAGKVKCPNDIFNTLGSICIGLFTSSVITLFTFNDKTKNWCIITMICICVLSAILAIVFMALHYNQRSKTTLLGQDIIEEMDAIEKTFDTPVAEGIEYPLE